MSVYTSFKINESSDYGRFIIATRSFDIGEVILNEAPLLVAPLGIKTIQYDEAGHCVVMNSCMGCFKMSKEKMLICHCGLPVCSAKCANEQFHKRYECALFKNRQIEPNQSTLGKLHIILIRACLMYKDREHDSSWQQFTELSSKLSKQTSDDEEFYKNEIGNAIKLINYVCRLGVDATTVGMILKTFIVNVFLIKGKDENGCSYEADVFYKTASLFAHGCSPNAEWIILPTNQNGIKRWNIRIYAKRNILRNETITIPYVHDFLTSDTPTRRQTLAKELHFICECSRCNDPTEFYHYTSAMKCSCCGNTNLLPDNSYDVCSPWTCGVCGDCKDSSVIKNYIEDYEDSLHSLMIQQLPEEWDSTLEMFINSADERNLTSNHRVITHTVYYWLQAQNFKDLLEHTMESQLKFIKILERAKHCLKMFRMFGTLHSVVSVELVFAYAIASFYFKSKSLYTIEYNNYSPQEKLQIVTAVYTHLKIAVRIIQWNPYNVLYSPIRDIVLLRFNFWENQWKKLKGVQTVDKEVVDQMMSSYGIEGNVAIIVLGQIKTSLRKFWAWVYPLSGMATKDSNFLAPDVSLLSQNDFYFTN